MSKTYFEQMRELMENAETWMLFIPDLFDKADKQIERLETENKKLRELVDALYHIHFGTEGESFDAWEEFCPCDICEERHGGEAPCAYVTKDLADECCEPITKEIVKDRMRELGVEL